MTRTMRPPAAAALIIVISALGAAPAPAHADLEPHNVLLLWNSANADSTAVRNLYTARRPGIIELDLANPSLPTGTVSRAQFISMLRDPARAFINGTSTGNDLSQQIMSIVITRGLPTRVNGASEFEIFSTFASVDSELTLLQQDLEQPGSGLLPFRYSGQVDNTYHIKLNQTITGFARTIVKIAKNFIISSPAANFSAWTLSPFTAGEMYLVTRLDAAPNSAGTQLEHIEAMLERTRRMVVVRQHVQALLDEYPPAANQLDNDGILPIFPTTDDFSAAANFLGTQDITTLHDETNEFITGPELADQCRPLIALGTYGENHDVAPGAQNAPGAGVYINTYRFHPAACAITYESFNGNSIVNGEQRQDHQQVLEFISSGGGFTIANINEPFTYAVADLTPLLQNLLQFNLTFAEAAWSATPALSWVNVAVGDALARVVLIDDADLDLNADAFLTPEDLYTFFDAPVDYNEDTTIDRSDAEILRDELRFGETCTDIIVAE